MDKLMRYLGIIFILIGVMILVMYYANIFSSNAALVTAALFMVGGTVAHVYLNKAFAE